MKPRANSSLTNPCNEHITTTKPPLVPADEVSPPAPFAFHKMEVGPYQSAATDSTNADDERFLEFAKTAEDLQHACDKLSAMLESSTTREAIARLFSPGGPLGRAPME